MMPHLDAAQIYLKQRRRQRQGSQYERQSSGGQVYEIREQGSRFWANFTDHIDCGIFLDHRPVRQMIRRLAAGKRFLNLFGYTATATVSAALGGACASETVDMSPTYLHWAAETLARNGLSQQQHQLVRAEVRAYLAAPGASFDLILLDPPTYSNSKRSPDDLDVQRDHVDLVDACMQRLAPGGSLIFSSHAGQFKLDAALQARYGVRDITAQSTAFDFARKRAHCCYLIEARPAGAGAAAAAPEGGSAK